MRVPRVGAYIELKDGDVGVFAQLEVGLGEARDAHAELDIHGKQAAHHLAWDGGGVSYITERACIACDRSDGGRMRRKEGEADGGIKDLNELKGVAHCRWRPSDRGREWAASWPSRRSEARRRERRARVLRSLPELTSPATAPAVRLYRTQRRTPTSPLLVSRRTRPLPSVRRCLH